MCIMAVEVNLGEFRDREFFLKKDVTFLNFFKEFLPGTAPSSWVGFFFVEIF